ncbi:MAG: hypothetical protein A2806_04040 [Candidatus Terrybacteria bacterium RIFCSPHIGHO2_01_FULL_48_17]|uniref:VWFA domain-containing protein n=1 Tax=Candidatus Terrybacteria bacterium RIFCSPHIGHO2_01_FULL_48_17 TaxID=1802362 RepID=A0A1G2PM66_9BACT|nr:MAG: hypothetical protein A2806_04040 [Candidatus Terrybacteria bacterium RIFCSPHIGHO2_01_FULL_48_17]OHA53754.1 MAG: hypothetical protein A3A30_05295 [Candidatus Terrybacteria bacterium RIFCSPLOWO2_01_FULL_48_14]
MNITFLAPEQALWGLTFVAAFFYLILSDRKAVRVRRAFALPNIGYRRTFISGFLLLVLAASFAAIAARPVTFAKEPIGVRQDAAIVFLFDASESMAAEPVATSGALNRLERAKLMAQEVAEAHPDIPTGIYAFTDILVPHLPVSSDRNAIRVALADVVKIGSVPVRTYTIESSPGVITTLQPIILRARYLFPEYTTQRILVVFSDGDFASSTRYAIPAISERLLQNHIKLVTVAVGNWHERIPEVTKEGMRTGRYVRHIPAVDEQFLRTFAEESQGMHLTESDSAELGRFVGETVVDSARDASLERIVVKDRTWWFVIVAASALILLVLWRLGTMILLRSVASHAVKIVLRMARIVLSLRLRYR